MLIVASAMKCRSECACDVAFVVVLAWRYAAARHYDLRWPSAAGPAHARRIGALRQQAQEASEALRASSNRRYTTVGGVMAGARYSDAPRPAACEESGT